MRRVHSVLPQRAQQDPQLARQEGLILLVQVLRNVLGGEMGPPILNSILGMFVSNNLEVQIVADLVNRATREPVELYTGSRRGMTWLSQRIATPNGKRADFEVLFYWRAERAHVAVRLQGDPEAMALCTIDCLWTSVSADYESKSEPLSLEDAIAASADLE